MERLHVYLIVSDDCSQAFTYTNLQAAKSKEKELINCHVWEWLDIWCDPLDYDQEDNSPDIIDHKTSKPWELLKLSYEQGHWFARAKYMEELFDDVIKRRSK